MDILRKNDFLKNTLTLVIGIAASQIIVFIVQLFLRRLYTPEQFGAYDVYFNLFGILAVLATLRYELAIILPKNDEEAANILFLSMLFSFFFSLIVLSIFLIFKNAIGGILHLSNKYVNWLLIMPFTIFFFCSYQGMNYWLIRKKAYKLSSGNKIVRRSFEGGIQMGLGYLKYSFGLPVGDLFGNVVNFLLGSIQIFRQKFSLVNISKRNILYVSRRYIEFPKYNLIPNLLNTLSTAMPFLIINKYYGSSITGYFGLSKMILAIPIALISTAVSQVLFQKISERKNAGSSIKTDFHRIVLYLLILAVSEVILLNIWGKEIILFLFNSTWERSGDFIKILVIASAVNFVVSPLSILFAALEKIKVQAIWQSGYFLLILSLLIVRNFKIDHFLYIYVMIDVFSYIVYYILIMKIVNQYESSLITE